MLRQHWVRRASEQETWDLFVLSVWTRSGRLVFTNPVSITYRLKFTDARLRDQDNYIGGTKYITDALKRTFITRDDAQWAKIHIEMERGEHPETEVTIEEAREDVCQ
jgi:Holliday junction resolvase RusA-like endonuclease